MASQTSKAAHRGDGGDLREEQSGRAAFPELHQDESWPQDRLVAAVPRNGRQRYEIRLKTFEGGVRRACFCLRDSDGRGGFKATGPTIAIAPNKLEELVGAFEGAIDACREEGEL